MTMVFAMNDAVGTDIQARDPAHKEIAKEIVEIFLGMDVVVGGFVEKKLEVSDEIAEQESAHRDEEKTQGPRKAGEKDKSKVDRHKSEPSKADVPVDPTPARRERLSEIEVTLAVFMKDIRLFHL